MGKISFINPHNHAVQLVSPNGKHISVPPKSKIVLDEWYKKYVPRYIRYIDSVEEQTQHRVMRKTNRVVRVGPRTRPNVNRDKPKSADPKPAKKPQILEHTKVEPGTMTIAVPPGIGDSLWSMTKIPDIRKKHNPNKVRIIVRNTSLNRSDDFLSRFSFVDEVVYENFPIHPPGRDSAYSKEGPYVYIESQKNWHGYDYLLISNGALERGMRLERWYPRFETDFNVGRQWRFDREHLDEVSSYKKENGPYFVFYLGPPRGNTLDGHNRGPLWSLQDWYKLAELLHNEYGYNIFITGAPYDSGYSDEFMKMVAGKDYIINKVGEWPIGLTYSYILHSEAVFSYQSGIGIFSVYLSIPTVLWWRPYGNSISPRKYISFKEEMASAWAPVEEITSGRYMPCIYTRCSPEGIFGEVKRRNWVGSRPEPVFTDEMTLAR